LRHLVATLAYRAAKVLRDVPPGFPEFSMGKMTRTPLQILEHLGDLMAWSVQMAQKENVWKAGGSNDWDTELKRFFDQLAELDRFFASGAPLTIPAEKLIQGPLADALTHVGQLAMLRGAAGAPIHPESYVRANIVAGSVGIDQSPPGREFDGDASAHT